MDFGTHVTIMSYGTRVTIIGYGTQITDKYELCYSCDFFRLWYSGDCDAHLLDKYAICYLGDHCRLKIGSHVANMGDAPFVFKIHCLTDISSTVGI